MFIFSGGLWKMKLFALLSTRKNDKKVRILINMNIVGGKSTSTVCFAWSLVCLTNAKALRD